MEMLSHSHSYSQTQVLTRTLSQRIDIERDTQHAVIHTCCRQRTYTHAFTFRCTHGLTHMYTHRPRQSHDAVVGNPNGMRHRMQNTQHKTQRHRGQFETKDPK